MRILIACECSQTVCAEFRELGVESKTFPSIAKAIATQHTEFLRRKLVRKICIDPGHGGIHPGACYFGEKEKNLTLRISEMLRSVLLEAGHKVTMTRHNDVDMSLTDRCRIANRDKSNLFISIHCNASYNKSAFGPEMYYWHTSTSGQLVARSIMEELHKLTGCNARKYIKNSSFTTLRRTLMPSIVAECGYMSNEDEFNKLCTTTHQYLIVQGIVRGINNYFRLTMLNKEEDMR